jgi:multiple sugar transport system ATP-binding protein
MAEVRLENVSKRYGRIDVIAGLTLTVRDGELFTIVGPSGCGKSTLLHLIAGLDTPTEGRILFDGQDVTEMPPRARDVALVFQSYALYPHMTVAENLAFPLRVATRRIRRSREEIAAEVRRVADLLGLAAVLERRPRELSGGQRQRVALGRALIRRPRVFLLDEPLSNLDAQLRAGMRAELRKLHDDVKTTTIYVTHDQTEAMTLADRLAVLDRGRLQQIGTPRDLYDKPANRFVAGFIGSPPMNLLNAHIEGDEVRAGSIRLRFPRPIASRPATTAVTLGIRPEHTRVRPADAAGDGGGIAGTVRLTELAGSQLWVSADLSGHDTETILIGLADATARLRPGDRVAISLAEAVFHWFDAETGERIAPGLGAAPGQPGSGLTP